MASEESPDWLPAGWSMQIKVRNSGRKDRCYTAPLTGSKFYSKNEVFRYLEAQKHGSTSKPKKRDIDIQSAGDVVIEKVPTDELPPGWIMEIKTTKKDNKIRKDPYYTDPATGYVFRSRKDVFRYLETGIIGRLASKPKKRGSNYENSPPIAAKRQKVAVSKTKRSLFKGQSSELSGSEEDKQILQSSVTETCLPVSKHSLDQCEEITNLGDLTLPEAEPSKETQNTVPTEHVSAPAVVVLPEKHPLENGEENKEERKKQLPPKKSKPKKELPVPHRISKRLAGIKAEPLVLTNDPPHQAATTPIVDTIPQVAAIADSSGFSIVTKSLSNKDQNPKEDQTASIKCGENIESEDQTPSIKYGEKIVSENQTASINCGEKIESEDQTASINCGENIEFEETNEKPESPLILPFGDSWPDPCLEFAFKTLTGAIPVAEDNLVIQDYFQKQLNTVSQIQSNKSLMEPDFSLDTTDLFQFETPVNGGIPHPHGENVLQHPNGEANK